VCGDDIRNVAKGNIYGLDISLCKICWGQIANEQPGHAINPDYPQMVDGWQQCEYHPRQGSQQCDGCGFSIGEPRMSVLPQYWSNGKVNLCPGCYIARNDWHTCACGCGKWVRVDCEHQSIERETIYCEKCGGLMWEEPRGCSECEKRQQQNAVVDLEAKQAERCESQQVVGTNSQPCTGQHVAVNVDSETVEDVEPPKVKAKQTPEQKQSKTNIWEAVKFAWELNDNAAWKLAKLQQFFMGTIKKSGKYKDFFDVQLDIPANALEVVAFGHWYKTEYDNISMPENGPKLRSHFETFRGSGERYQTFMRKAITTVTSKIPKIVMEGINDTPEVEEPEEEETITDEQKAEVFRMMKELEDKFSNRGVR
jgi:hypothetical protein